MDSRLLALKREMGLIEAPDDEEPKQLAAGEGEVVEAEHEVEGEAVEAEPAEEAEAEVIPIREAELLEEFERLEKRDQG
jgi:hypothetical protein